MSLVSDRILELAVQRVRRNCRIAADTRQGIPRHRAEALVLTVNEQVLTSALESAQLVLDNEPVANPRRSREIRSAVPPQGGPGDLS